MVRSRFRVKVRVRVEVMVRVRVRGITLLVPNPGTRFAISLCACPPGPAVPD